MSKQLNRITSHSYQLFILTPYELASQLLLQLSSINLISIIILSIIIIIFIFNSFCVLLYFFFAFIYISFSSLLFFLFSVFIHLSFPRLKTEMNGTLFTPAMTISLRSLIWMAYLGRMYCKEWSPNNPNPHHLMLVIL